MAPLQAGAMLGPLAGSGVLTLIPALADAYAVTVGTAGLAVTAYMVPFALAQLLSGAVAQALSPRRTAAAGYAVYVAASLACAWAPTLPIFLGFRLVQGLGSAFLFPVLMALVGEAVAPERLGRAFGVFGVTQTLGLTLGPLVAGFLQVHAGWQWFFVAQAVFAVASAVGFLALFRGERGPARGAGPGILAVAWSALAERSVILLSVAAALLFLSMMGTYTYLAAWLRDTQGVAEDRVGIVLGVAGAMGIPAAPLAGRWLDRLGRRAVALLGMAGYIAVLGAFVVAPYTYTGVLVLAALLGWTALIAWTALNTLAVEIVPALRQPVASIYNAFRFGGYALAPPLLGLVYGPGRVAAVYLVCALAAVAAAALVTLLPPLRGHSRLG
jgi:predicted MFS family arabinose efflux permease